MLLSTQRSCAALRRLCVCLAICVYFAQRGPDAPVGPRISCASHIATSITHVNSVEAFRGRVFGRPSDLISGSSRRDSQRRRKEARACCTERRLFRTRACPCMLQNRQRASARLAFFFFFLALWLRCVGPTPRSGPAFPAQATSPLA